MTREEYKKIKKDLEESMLDFPIVNAVLDIMKKHIKEQEPCEDCISNSQNKGTGIKTVHGHSVDIFNSGTMIIIVVTVERNYRE